MMSKVFIITSKSSSLLQKVWHDVNRTSWCDKVYHKMKGKRNNVTKFVMKSQSWSWRHQVRHGIKNTPWRQKVCHDVTSLSWSKKYFMMSKSVSWSQNAKQFVMKIKTRHDVKKFVITLKTYHGIQKCVIISKTRFIIFCSWNNENKYVTKTKSWSWR